MGGWRVGVVRRERRRPESRKKEKECSLSPFHCPASLIDCGDLDGLASLTPRERGNGDPDPGSLRPAARAATASEGMR